MAQYLILIYQDEATRPHPGEEGFEQHTNARREFWAANAAVLRGGSSLESTDTATSIRKDSSGDFIVTDAPFAETKEALAGYVLVETENLDEAIAVAKQLAGPSGGVEVRPLRAIEGRTTA